MVRIFNFGTSRNAPELPANAALARFVDGYSVEVTPRTAEKIPDFRALLPEGTRVYIAHIGDTPMEEMLATARRLTDEGFAVMPHFPARLISGRDELERRIAAYADLGVHQALLLGGGADSPAGAFDNAMQLLESGLFDKHGFTRLHVAGHPEGNRDIDPDATDRPLMEALRWKDDFARRTDAQMAIVTQFCFESEPVIAWADRLAAEGIGLPIHIGIAGPAKLQTLIRYAMACGVGPSLRVLQRRAADLSKLVLPFTPERILTELAEHKAAHPDFNIASVHVFPLGGLGNAAEFMNGLGRASVRAAVRA